MREYKVLIKETTFWTGTVKARNKEDALDVAYEEFDKHRYEFFYEGTDVDVCFPKKGEKI